MPRSNRGQGASSTGIVNCSYVGITVLLLTNVLVFQFTFSYMNTHRNDQVMLEFLNDYADSHEIDAALQHADYKNVAADNRLAISPPAMGEPKGEAVALPSIRTDENFDREIYGGKGDGKHLGGFTTYDGMGVSPDVWKFMINTLGVHSLLDVGCGRGISTSWFAIHGVFTLCVEGSHDAIENTIIPKQLNPEKILVEHDFSRGPWWPSHTVDAIWCVEFLEHVGRNYQQNYIPAFRQAAIIFTTHSS